MRKIIFGLAGLGLAGAAAVTFGLGAGAGEGRPLGELLDATHVHGLAVDRSDPGRLLIATHHGVHALRIEDGTVVPVSETRDDFMGFTPHPEDPNTLYASGHPAEAAISASSRPATAARRGSSSRRAPAGRSTSTRWT